MHTPAVVRTMEKHHPNLTTNIYNSAGAMTDCGDAHAGGGALTFFSAIIGSS